MIDINIRLDWHAIADRLIRYVTSQVYQCWDSGMTLRQAAEEGAGVPGMSPCPLGHPDPHINEHVQSAVQETFDDFFEDGFPHVGCPDRLREEIERHVIGVMYEWFGAPPTKQKPKRIVV